MNNYLLGCDWGTSTFRLRLITKPDRHLLGEIRSPEGIASTFNAWKTSGEPQGISREAFFRQQLKKQVDLLSAQLAADLTGSPIIISGMASSSIGMAEVPYATLPFPIDGSLASTQQFGAQPNFQHDITLISGVRSEHDVMRGEETQLIGLAALADTASIPFSDAILLFPGTHSKHMYIQNRQVVNFHTFMTGEVFNLMANHSILTDSVTLSNSPTFSTDELTAFKAGVNETDSSILASLFKVRTNQLFGKLSKQQNACYLSGLLIGEELKTLSKQTQWPLILCSGNNLFELYKLAMEELDLSGRTTTIPADLIDQATIAGQLKLAQYQP